MSTGIKAGDLVMRGQDGTLVGYIPPEPPRKDGMVDVYLPPRTWEELRKVVDREWAARRARENERRSARLAAEDARRAHLAAMVAGDAPIVIPDLCRESMDNGFMDVRKPSEPIARYEPRHKPRWEWPTPWDPEGE